MKPRAAIDEVLAIMARLRGPRGCPWDHEQDHHTLRYHAVEEVYEMIDAIEAGDDHELEEELGDLLLQVVFHCQLARERGAFDFANVCRRLVGKLVNRHPHVFGDAKARDAGAVLEQWEKIKTAEKAGTRHERPSALDGVPKRLPALLRAQKVIKKATQAGLLNPPSPGNGRSSRTLKGAAAKRQAAELLLSVAFLCQENGWSAEDLLRQELKRRERAWRRTERQQANLRPTPTRLA